MEKYWIGLRSSLWFVPTVMVVASFGLALGLVELDTTLNLNLARRWPEFFGMSAEGARGIMVAIATSMITVTGVTFSVMIVALSLASNQFSPRILRNYMRDAGTKVVLGVFVAVFVYSLAVLQVIRTGENAFVPPISITVGIVLSLASVGFLVYFVHHISTEIQATTIVAGIAEETIATLKELYPSQPQILPRAAKEELAKLEQQTWTIVRANRSGYLQSVGPGVEECAHKHDVVLRIENKIGSFVAEGNALASVAGQVDAPAVRAIERLFGINNYRTIDQDPDFGIRQLVDIAIKALSPGINDTSTAINCIDRLGQIIHHLVQCYNPAQVCVYAGRVRVFWKHLSIEHLIDQSFHQIRQSASNNPAVVMRLLRTIGNVGVVAVDAGYIKVLEKHVALLEDVANGMRWEHDKNVILERVGEVRRKLSIVPSAS